MAYGMRRSGWGSEALLRVRTFARLDRAILFGCCEKDAPVKPGQGEKKSVRPRKLDPGLRRDDVNG